MRKSNASMPAWPALVVGIPLAGAAVLSGVNSWINGDQRPLTPQETYDRDYEFCMHGTGYELERPVWEDASQKRRVDTMYIGSLVVANTDEVTVIPGPPGEPNLPGKRLHFIFETINGVRTLTPADDFTVTFTADQGC